MTQEHLQQLELAVDDFGNNILPVLRAYRDRWKELAKNDFQYKDIPPDLLAKMNQFFDEFEEITIL